MARQHNKPLKSFCCNFYVGLQLLMLLKNWTSALHTSAVLSSRSGLGQHYGWVLKYPGVVSALPQPLANLSASTWVSAEIRQWPLAQAHLVPSPLFLQTLPARPEHVSAVQCDGHGLHDIAHSHTVMISHDNVRLHKPCLCPWLVQAYTRYHVMYVYDNLPKKKGSLRLEQQNRYR